jgi:hypothetical protein
MDGAFSPILDVAFSYYHVFGLLKDGFCGQTVLWYEDECP